jgi:hypothetical protein
MAGASVGVPPQALSTSDASIRMLARAYNFFMFSSKRMEFDGNMKLPRDVWLISFAKHRLFFPILQEIRAFIFEMVQSNYI